MTARFLDPANRATATAVPTTVIQQLPVVRQEGRGRQDNTGENADRGQRQRIKAARGDVAQAAEKYYNDMLEIQRKCADKYVEYLSAKMANEKAMHDKEIELKNKDLELKEAELQQMRQRMAGSTERASTPATRPPLSTTFNSPEVEHYEHTPGPPGEI